jgi:hypothetical protein
MQCPQCHQPIEGDFGVVTCSSCQSVLFIDMDGNVQLSEGNSDSGSSSASYPVSIPSSDLESVPSTFEENWLAQDLGPADPQETAFTNSLEEPIFESENDQDQGRDQIKSSDPEEAQDSADLSEVSKFANSDQAYGPLTYSVIIEAIDTREIRQDLLAVLADPKFQWDHHELGRKIKSGRLRLENLNPVKASVLIQKLQDVSVKVSWTQNVYS